MNPVLEQATAADLDEVALLYESINRYLADHTNYPGWKKDVYPAREDAENGVNQGTLYVLRRDGRIAGTVILEHKTEPAYGTVDWGLDLTAEEVMVVYTLAVHPDFLGTGIGKALMEAVIAFCREKQVKAIRLDVYEKNSPAIGLYKKYGFSYIGMVDLGYSHFGLDQFELYQKIL